MSADKRITQAIRKAIRRLPSRGPLYDASPEWLKKVGLTRRDAGRLFNALSALVDYEGSVVLALNAKGRSYQAHQDTCEALRYLVDGEQ